MTERKERNETCKVKKALEEIRKLGIEIRSYTVYPGKGSLKANITIQTRGGRGESRES